MDPVALELEYVRRVYEKISKNFSNTRYKAWPAVVRFLEGVCNQVTTNGDLPRIGIDVGCGNGKNMLACSSDVCVIGLDL